MPLDKSANKKAIATNIAKLVAENRPQKQAIAIALNTQRRAQTKKTGRKK